MTSSWRPGPLASARQARCYGIRSLPAGSRDLAAGALYGMQYSDMSAFRAISREALECLALQEMTYGWNIEI